MNFEWDKKKDETNLQNMELDLMKQKLYFMALCLPLKINVKNMEKLEKLA